MNRQIKNGLIVSLLTLLICLLGFLPVILKNDSIFILYGDSVEQMYTFILGFWEKFHSLDFSLFEWSNGYGANVFTYFFYNLLSPFNLIYVLLPKDMIQHAMLYVSILKLMTLAFFSSLWLSKLFKKESVIRIGSLMITFSGWVLFYFHYHFLDAFLVYPLVLYFAECFLQEKKCKGLVISISCLTAINYYFSYLLIPFLWLYALFRYLILNKGTSFQSVLKDGTMFFLLSLIGIGISGVVLLPCAHLMMTSPRLSGDTKLSVFVGINDLFKIVTSLLSPVLSRIEPSNYILQNRLSYQGWGGGASLYTSITALIFVPQFLRHPDYHKRNLMLLFFSIIGVFMVCPYFYFLFQGSADTRFFYMASFLIVLMVCEVLETECYNNKLNYLMIPIIAVCAAFCLAVSNHFQMNTVELLLEQAKLQCVLLVFLFVSCMSLKRFGSKGLLAVIALESCFSLMIFVKYNPPIEKEYFNYTTGVNDTLVAIQSADHGFYRILEDSSSYSLSNDPYVYQVNGVSFYASVYGHEQEQYLERLKSRWSMPNYDGKYRLYTLNGAKYWYTDLSDPLIPVGYELVDGQNYYVNENHVELGYRIDQTLNASYGLSLPYLIQDRVLQEYLFIEDSDNQNYELNDRFKQIIEWGAPGWVEVYFEEPISDAILYVENFGIPVVEIDVYSQNTYLRTYSYWQYHYVDLYLTPDEEIDRIVIRCQDVDATGSNINAYIAYDASVTEREIAEKRRQEAFQNVVFHNDRIQAEITLSQDSYVLTQIPYDSGWNCLVDGEEVEIIKGNGGFVTLHLSAGSHEVEFNYHVPWMGLGLVISFCSIGLFIFLHLLQRYQMVKKQSDL